MTAPRPTVIDDLARFQTPSDPRLSPDGTRVAYTLRTVDPEKNRYVSRIWIGPADASAPPRPWTARTDSASNARWAPDGSGLAFVSSRDEKKAQLFWLPAGGGEAERLTDLPPGTLADFAFSPDGARIAFLFRAADEAMREDAVEARKKKSLSTPPREITRLRFRTEGTGFLPAEPFRMWLLERASGEATALDLCQDRDIAGFCWSPDGHRIAFVRNVADDPDRWGAQQGLFEVELATGAVSSLTDQPGPKGNPTYSPDGARLAYVGHDNPGETWGVRNSHVWVVERDSGVARDLTADWDVTVGDVTLGEVSGRGDNGPLWADDGAAVIAVVSEAGRVDVWRMPVDGGAPERLWRDTVGVSLAAGKLARLVVSPTDAGDVFVDDVRISSANAALLAEIALAEPEVLAVTAPDGMRVPCLALLPPDFDPQKRYPTLVYIHGGPHLMYGERHLFHEYQALAAAGYVVLYPNPRGSKGYGEAWTGAIQGDWGAPAMDDVMACVDAAIAKGWSDPERLGVLGGSYGGYLTAWIVGHTDRFKAAMPERGVFDLVSMAGTCDFPWRPFDYFAGNTTDDTEALRRNSPLTYAETVRTPLLIVHSEGDLRCPIGQADQYFRAVAQAGNCEIRYLRFGPEANHELSRGGPPDLRLERQRRIHAWFDRFLKEN